MTSYVTSDYYKNNYKGTQISDAELDSYLQRASFSIDQVTRFKIASKGGFASLTPFQQGCVSSAVCVQADHLYSYGDMPAVTLESYSVGDNSVKMGKNIDMRWSRQALDYLLPTNLLYRGGMSNEITIF